MMVSDKGVPKHKIHIREDAAQQGCLQCFDSQRIGLPRTREAWVPVRYHTSMVLDLSRSP